MKTIACDGTLADTWRQAGVAVDDADLAVYVLADQTVRASPDAWARRAIDAYWEHKADVLVVEANQGGDLVTSTLHGSRFTVSVCARRTTAAGGG